MLRMSRHPARRTPLPTTPVEPAPAAEAWDYATLRRLAVEASADPRTVRRRLRGQPVRGLAAERIDLVLARYGLHPDQRRAAE